MKTQAQCRHDAPLEDGKCPICMTFQPPAHTPMCKPGECDNPQHEHWTEKTAGHTPIVKYHEARYNGIVKYRVDVVYETRAEAEAHVHAVNTHEKLLEALKCQHQNVIDSCYDGAMLQHNKNTCETCLLISQAEEK